VTGRESRRADRPGRKISGVFVAELLDGNKLLKSPLIIRLSGLVGRSNACAKELSFKQG